MAHEKFSNFSGYGSLLSAPEYYLTSRIAESLHDADLGYVTLEHHVREVMTTGGGLKRGQPTRALRLDGRADIVLWNGDDTPRAIIEIKHPLYEYTVPAEKDIQRIKASFSSGKEGLHSLTDGVFAFWTGTNAPKRKDSSAKERLERKTTDIKDAVCNTLGEGYRVTRFIRSHVVPDDEGEWAWAAVVFVVNKVA
ncbi:MAG: type I restriction enzyme HsdR N-terminal domain-containing protein [Gammaproteobacteria bacterium]|nr:type I restriction enzyme HsdR N-terminal domain-containing protein [Gammaproteobacteria bacterium]MBU1731464.1 type I restriction enzyme HsdR N-terminal domain-containing protein [Gammaproteobacteria bacterium]MBU1892969.1 type I restriction enzyme HsdR N-terminal domain-containing protein [Gammaproteobacteria bacterium]